MSSLSRPQSSAAVRAHPSSPLKYSSQNTVPLHTDPTAVFASESRKFLSSRKGERQYTSPAELDREYSSSGNSSSRNRSGSYSASTTTNSPSPASPESYYMHQRAPPVPGYSNGRQQMAAEIGRSATSMSRSQQVSSPTGIYPSLPPSTGSPLRSRTPSTIAPYSSYHAAGMEDPYASHRYRSPVHSPPPSSTASTASTTTTRSPPPSLPQSPTRPLHPISNGSGAVHHSHSRHHSLSSNVNAYATDYAGGNSRLVPQRNHPMKRHTQQYPSSSNGNGLGAVGPALAQNIPPVLPRPPSLKGSSSTTSTLGRNGSLRGSVSEKREVKTVTDEERAAYAALNTYR